MATAVIENKSVDFSIAQDIERLACHMESTPSGWRIELLTPKGPVPPELLFELVDEIKKYLQVP